MDQNASCKTTLKLAISTIHHFILLKLEIRCLLWSVSSVATLTIDASSKATLQWPYVTSDNDVGNIIPFLNKGVFQIPKIVYVPSSSNLSTNIILYVLNQIHIRWHGRPR